MKKIFSYFKSKEFFEHVFGVVLIALVGSVFYMVWCWWCRLSVQVFITDVILIIAMAYFGNIKYGKNEG